MAEVDVLVIGAGPVGLTAALELRRRGIGCRIVDTLAERNPYAKAIGIQPRTWEIWEAMGIARAALDVAAPLYGQLIFVDRHEVARIEMTLPPNVPYGFAALPQYDTERLLTEELARWGNVVERSCELRSFTQDSRQVVAHVATPVGTEVIGCSFLLGCDGAHSTVRRGLGLEFEGDAFPEQYMLGDVEVDWDLPAHYAIRSMRNGDDGVDDGLVCIPLPGRNRYRMSMLVPPELEIPAGNGSDVAHGLEAGNPPELHHIQAVLDRLSPQPTTASTLRWSSVFRISHRIVNRYRDARVFVAGDAAHIHPPTGAQGMNTGIQDAYNLAWKLALTIDGAAGDDLLDTYHAERFPVGEEVVGRTVRHAREGIDADPDDPSTIIQREAQLLVNYRGSPIVGRNGRPGDGPAPGDRAPDCGGLTHDIASFPGRLFEVLDERTHTVLLYANSAAALASCPDTASAVRQVAPGRLHVTVVLAADVASDGQDLPVARDSSGEFRATYGVNDGEILLIRPDGYLGFRGTQADLPELVTHLDGVFAA